MVVVNGCSKIILFRLCEPNKRRTTPFWDSSPLGGVRKKKNGRGCQMSKKKVKKKGKKFVCPTPSDRTIGRHFCTETPMK